MFLDKTMLRGLLAAVLVACTVSARADTITDPLNGTAINSQIWQIYTDPGTEGVNMTPTTQGLEISFASTEQNAGGGGNVFGADLLSQAQWNLPGDFNVQVGYTLLNWPSTNGVRVGIIVGGTDSAVTERVSHGTSSDFPGHRVRSI